jgi:uncharacterized membrane protein
VGTKKILLTGETWTVQTIEVKGFDHFTVCSYGEGTKWIRNAVEKAGYEFVHIAAHKVNDDFPDSAEKLAEYSAVLISDVGKNTFLLPPVSFFQSKRTPNKLALIREYVEAGGGFGMIGGYMTFMGIDGRAGYKDTVIETVLPVTLMAGDDRVEIPEGIVPAVPAGEGFWSGLPSEWPFLLGYNRLAAKAGTRVLLRGGDDPLIVVGEYGKGRTLAFATDCAPHWAPPEFCDWEYYPEIWKRLLVWLIK